MRVFPLGVRLPLYPTDARSASARIGWNLHSSARRRQARTIGADAYGCPLDARAGGIGERVAASFCRTR